MAYLSITLELGSFIFFVKVLMARANYLGAKASFYYGNLKGVKKKTKNIDYGVYTLLIWPEKK